MNNAWQTKAGGILRNSPIQDSDTLVSPSCPIHIFSRHFDTTACFLPTFWPHFNDLDRFPAPGSCVGFPIARLVTHAPTETLFYWRQDIIMWTINNPWVRSARRQARQQAQVLT